MKAVLILLTLTFSFSSFAQNSPMNMKERLRLLLWTQGLSEVKVHAKNNETQKQNLPEELERPLRNF